MPTFVKTSTGFSTSGATESDVRLMRQAVGGSIGVKASGGIRSLDALRRMVEWRKSDRHQFRCSDFARIFRGHDSLAAGRERQTGLLLDEGNTQSANSLPGTRELLDFLLEVARLRRKRSTLTVCSPMLPTLSKMLCRTNFSRSSSQRENAHATHALFHWPPGRSRQKSHHRAWVRDSSEPLRAAVNRFWFTTSGAMRAI